MSNLDLAVIGNCILGALIDRDARVVWMGFPRFDQDPVFCRLLDDGAEEEKGFLDVQLEGQTSSHQHYVRNTAIVETTLESDDAAIRITDFAPRFHQLGRAYRSSMIIRRIEAVRGTPRIRIRMRPRFAYGERKPRRTVGSNHIRYYHNGGALRLTTDAPISYVAEERDFVLSKPVNLFIMGDESLGAPIAETARDFLERTHNYWTNWVRNLSIPFEWQEPVIRAAITLKLCSFEETGAVLAALTTSIPEAPNTVRTWDYRYCWLRDSLFTVQTLNRLSTTVTMENYIDYITNVVALSKDGRLKPVYSIVPGTPLDEHEVTSLAGYRGTSPVRVGNDAENQVQNDVYGSVILAVTQMFFDRRLPTPGTLDLFENLEKLGERAYEVALTPDASLWEFRGIARVHTFSAVMCWAACDRLAKIAAVLDLPERATLWQQRADELDREIQAKCWDEKQQTIVGSFGGEELDASLLLLHEVGFLDAEDPRYVATVEAIGRRLKRGKFLLRYAVPDDFGVPETAFTVCTFWYIDALAAIGRREEARELFEEVLAIRNHVGLLSEDVNPDTGELWGNFPQTYSMVGLIVSAMRLSQSWEDAFWRGGSAPD